HLHKARMFLQDAQLCTDHGRYDSAVSRAYYAMFRAAIGLLEHYGDVRPGWNHGRVERALLRNMVYRRALLQEDDIDELKETYVLRIVADYEDRDIGSHEAQARCSAASSFVAKIEGIISHATHT